MTDGGEYCYPKEHMYAGIDPVRLDKGLFETVWKVTEGEKYAFFYDEAFAYGSFRKDGLLYVTGPALIEWKSSAYLSYYLKRHGSIPVFHVPYMQLDEFMHLLYFFYGLLVEDYEVGNGDHLMMARLQHQMTKENINAQLNSIDNVHIRAPYGTEQIVRSKIMNGEKPIINREDWSPGFMSENSIKQYEYECVSAITVTTRVAVDVGVLENRAFEISDMVLRKLSQARSLQEMKQIYDYGNELFNAEIKNIRTKDNMYVSAAKNYIAQHIYGKIRLDEIGKAVGLNSSYLSTVFKKETGQALSKYILEKKIDLCCNLLKYSDSSISDIAEYMQIVPQSYFTKVFKEVMGTTPEQYRKQNKTLAFYEQ